MNAIIKKKKSYRAGLIMAALVQISLLACSQNTHKEVMPNEGADHCLSPYFVVLTEGSESEQLPLKSTEVDVNIAGVIADVKVKQSYSNTGKTPIEAIYIFPASTQAAVYEMVMKVNDREIVAIVEEKQSARKLYETAKNEGKTASLLEEQRPNVFQMNVANIMPGAHVEVTLSYTEMLVPSENIYEFVYPTVVGPRYVSNAEYVGETDENWTANPYLKEGIAPTSTFNLKLNISTGIPLKEIRCETHKNNIEYLDKSNAVLTLNDKNGGNKDFIVQYKLAGNQIESGIIVYEDPHGEQYFLGMMQPPERVAPDNIPPREYIFIVDVSGSMSGFPLEISKRLMKELLNGLKPKDKFNIVQFAGGSSTYSKESLYATPENVTKAINYMDNFSGGGGTELLNALHTAMAQNTSEEYSRSFVILTDGYVSVEKETFDYIRNNLGQANFFAFGIGSSVNRYIIEGMAHVGMGEPFIATNQKEAVKQANKMLHHISSPVLTQISYNLSSIEAYDLLPDKIPDLFASRPIIISGKFKGNLSGSIIVNGTYGNKTYKQSLTISKNSEKSDTKALKYLWAREKIRLIGDYNKLSHDSETQKQIVELGKKYNLLTEYTSFIAIDSEVSNPTSNSVTVKQPLPLPDGVSNYAVGNSTPMARKAYLPGKYNKLAEKTQSGSNYDLAIQTEEEESSPDDEVFCFVEQMPMFQGGDIAQFQQYVQTHLEYPKEAIEAAIQGTVFVKFVIDENGNITDVEVIRSIDKLLDDAALKAVKSSPKWIPGKQRGKPVKVTFTIPVRFLLN
jgi:Ca-activated chloride channel homolog